MLACPYYHPLIAATWYVCLREYIGTGLSREGEKERLQLRLHGEPGKKREEHIMLEARNPTYECPI